MPTAAASPHKVLARPGMMAARMVPPSVALRALRVVRLQATMAVLAGPVATEDPAVGVVVPLAYMALAIMAQARMPERVTQATRQRAPTARSTPRQARAVAVGACIVLAWEAQAVRPVTAMSAL